MKKVILKLGVIFFYLLILLSASGFHLSSILDSKSILLVLLGTVMLSLTGCKNKITIIEFKRVLPWNAQMTGYLTSFIFLFITMSSGLESKNLYQEIVLALRPILYALILQILFKEEEKDAEIESNPFGQVRKESQKEMSGKIVIEMDEFEAVILDLRKGGLTEREIEVAKHLCLGDSNIEIGEKLFISQMTVKKHLSNLYRKTAIENREQFRYYISNLLKNKKEIN